MLQKNFTKRHQSNKYTLTILLRFGGVICKNDLKDRVASVTNLFLPQLQLHLSHIVLRQKKRCSEKLSITYYV